MTLCLLLYSTTLKTDDGDILLDYSKNLITQDVLDMLLALVTASGQPKPSGSAHTATCKQEVDEVEL